MASPKSHDPALVATAAALLAAPNGRMRLPHVLAALQISRSNWYQGIAEKRYPAGTRIGKRAVAWSSAVIRAIVARDAVEAV